jgi:hypothetical protein
LTLILSEQPCAALANPPFVVSASNNTLLGAVGRIGSEKFANITLLFAEVGELVFIIKGSLLGVFGRAGALILFPAILLRTDCS